MTGAVVCARHCDETHPQDHGAVATRHGSVSPPSITSTRDVPAAAAAEAATAQTNATVRNLPLGRTSQCVGSSSSGHTFDTAASKGILPNMGEFGEFRGSPQVRQRVPKASQTTAQNQNPSPDHTFQQVSHRLRKLAMQWTEDSLDTISQMERGAPSDALIKTTGPMYRRYILQVCKDNEATNFISAAQYKASVTRLGSSAAFGPGTVVLCTLDELRGLIEISPPLANILVPPEWNETPQAPLTCDAVFAHLQAIGREVDVQVTYAKIHPKSIQVKGGASAVAEKLSVGRVVEIFKQPDAEAGPINLLSVPGSFSNLLPDLEGVASFNFMDWAAKTLSRDVNNSGSGAYDEGFTRKDIKPEFVICGQKGVFSMPHVDPHITVIAPQDGRKLWPVLASSNPDAARQFFLRFSDPERTYGQLPSKSVGSFLRSMPWTPLALEPGAVLVMPHATVHAPYSHDDVVCTGSMHMDSRAILCDIQLANQMLVFPEITNDDPEPGYVYVVAHALRMWKEPQQLHLWGSERERLQSLEELRMLPTKVDKDKTSGFM
ncbi:putative JmjC domain-containing protein [Seiridium cardinale]